MPLTRRQFLSSSAACLAFPASVSAVEMPLLTAQPGLQQLAPEGYAPTPMIWGFDGQVPGPEIRVRKGQPIRRRVLNGLDQPLSVHWHGIRIDNAMDGVPGLTQAPAAPGDSFDYTFVAPDAGTYWYHAHTASMEQVARGLYGPLIIEEHLPPDIDQDITLLIDDWKLDPETVEILDDFDNFHDLSHAGRLGNLLTVNGQFDPGYPVQHNQRLRLRLINTANARLFELALTGMEGWIVALDGMPLNEPMRMSERVVMAPGQRVDLMLDVTEPSGGTAELAGVEHGQGFGLVRFPVNGVAAGTRRSGVAALPSNDLPDLTGAAEAPVHEMRMTGGAMRGLAPSTMGHSAAAA